MADSPSSILLLRLQSTGSNTNLWGGYLNTALQTQERASKGYQALAVTGDATISWTNYSAANDGSVAFLKLTGSLSSAATLTFPSYQHSLFVWNATGAAVTIKCSGGTGVTIPNGMRTAIYCDATDYYSSAPNWLNSYQGTLTNNGDVVVKNTLETALANLAAPASAGTVLNSAADTTAGYLSAKFTVQISTLTTTQVSGLTSLTFSTVHAGGIEQIAVAVSPGYAGGFLPGANQSSQFTPVVGTEYNCDLTSSSWTVNIGGMTTPQLGQRIKLNCFGNYPAFLNGTFMNQSYGYLPIGFDGELCYSGSSWGWN